MAEERARVSRSSRKTGLTCATLVLMTFAMICFAGVSTNIVSESTAVGKAAAAGIKVVTPAEAAAWADVVMILTPDEGQADLYRNDLAANLRPGTALVFAHGLNIHFKLIEARADIDVFSLKRDMTADREQATDGCTAVFGGLGDQPSEPADFIRVAGIRLDQG